MKIHSIRLERASGFLLLILLAVLYRDALRHGTPPPGHPWAGLFVGGAAIAAVLRPIARWRESPVRAWSLAGLGALSLAAGARWAWWAATGA